MAVFNKVEPMGRFKYGDNTFYIDGVGHRMEDIIAMSPEQEVKVLCSDGTWYKVKKKDITFFQNYEAQYRLAKLLEED